MAPLSKWIDTLAADGRVSDAARVSLEARLAAVSYWLPLAARQIDEDVEKVHQLRVATRRAIAALNLYEDWLPRRPARWLIRRLKTIRRAAGAARDLDVLADWLRQELGDGGGGPLAWVAKERAAAQPKIMAMADRCEKDNSFRRKMNSLLADVRPRGRVAKTQDVSFRNWAEMRLGQAAERFFAAIPNQNSDLSALHKFRIRGKQLRYALELLAPAFGPDLRELHYPVVQELQELLGRINDCVAGDARLRRWRRKTESSAEQELLGKLIERRRLQLDEAVAQYRAWWTTERAETLRQGLLAQTTAVETSVGAGLEDQPARAEETEASGVGLT
jgi:CHAD domain-containing protein